MKELICIVCPQGCRLRVDGEGNISGNACANGAEYAHTELTAPTRVLTSTVDILGAELPRCPVKTAGAIPKHLLFQAMEALRSVTVSAPVKTGQVIIADIAGTGVDLVATRDMDEVK